VGLPSNAQPAKPIAASPSMIDATLPSQPAVPASPLYERVAQQLTHLINHGTLRPGDRIPSIRKMVDQQSVSVSTVLQAYQVLESRGLIEARPQSGFYVRARRWTPPPEPEISRPPARAQKLTGANLVMEVVGTLNQPGFVQLGAAVPPAEMLPTRELHRALAAAARHQPGLANSCDPSIGLPTLRVEIAQRLLEAGCSLSPDDLIITNGATEALHLCLRAVTRPGDTVAIESPTYFGILKILEMLGLRACEIPTSPNEGICLEALTARLACCRIKACVFMTNFSNPLGSCMPEETKRRLVELLAERKIPLIEDDIYGSLAFAPTRPHVAKSYDSQGLVLLCSALTKTLAPGYRIGWTAPGIFSAEVHRLRHTSSLGNPMVTQLAVAEFLATGGYERHLRHLRRTYAQSVEQVSDSVARHFPAGTRVTRPQGGHVLWVELPEKTDTLELHRVALANRITIAPGPIFSARQQYRNCLRLNCAIFWTDQVERALVKLGSLANRMAQL
jgi:DNA-binding transcriptional MocR family regulator